MNKILKIKSFFYTTLTSGFAGQGVVVAVCWRR